MRLPIVAALLAVAPLAACARHAERLVPAPQLLESFGTPDAFGGGIIDVSTTSVTVSLTAPAHVAVVRVFEGGSAQLAYPLSRYARGARKPLPAGARRLALSVERARDRIPDLAARNQRPGGDDNACRMRRTAYEASRPRDSVNVRRRTPFWDTCYSRPQHLDVRTEWTTVSGAPIPLGPHHLVVIATDARVDPVLLAQRLRDLDMPDMSGIAAARLVPGIVLDANTRWAAWVVERP